MNMNKVVILEGIVFAQTVLSGLTTCALGLSSSCKFPIVYNVPKIRLAVDIATIYGLTFWPTLYSTTGLLSDLICNGSIGINFHLSIRLFHKLIIHRGLYFMLYYVRCAIRLSFSKG